MNPLFWTGKLSLPVKLLINANNLLACFNSNSANKSSMKERVKSGYNGSFSGHIADYDKLAGEFQKKAAVAQLIDVDLTGMEIIDIGCGTGIISLLALEKGAKKVTCGDISEFMLNMAKKNFKLTDFTPDCYHFHQLDAESLPFENNCFDAVITGMSFGLFPDQEKAVSEMFRVLKPGGFISLGIHGPEHYWEAIDANIRSLAKRYVIGYRFEFWPKTEKQLIKMMINSGFQDVYTSRYLWRNNFRTPSDACDFFAAVSSNWWYAKIPENLRDQQYRKTKLLFEKKGIRQITDDVIIGYARKQSTHHGS